MSNDTDRRAFLKASVLLPSIATLGATAAIGQDAPPVDDLARSRPQPATPAVDDYKPAYFTPAEWAFVQAACARLIPNDANGPGALEAGAAEYIDRQMGTPYGDAGSWYMHGPFVEAAPEFGYQSALTPKQQYRLNIPVIDAWCKAHLGAPFASLSAAQQDHVLKSVEAGEVKADGVSPKAFFSSFLLPNVLEGFFCDPMYGGNRDMVGWKLIGHPGSRADFLEWVDKPAPYPYGPVDIYGRRG
ncbi:MAG: gluconate 2-dehydrogenase subunit 3 family protein [Caulobacteraceae bacterium]